MGQFSDLNPNAPWKEPYWDTVKGEMKEMLDELRSDVFNSGRWRIEANLRGVAPLLIPNIALTDGLQYLSIGVSHDKDMVRILARTAFKWI